MKWLISPLSIVLYLLSFACILPEVELSISQKSTSLDCEQLDSLLLTLVLNDSIFEYSDLSTYLNPESTSDSNSNTLAHISDECIPRVSVRLYNGSNRTLIVPNIQVQAIGRSTFECGNVHTGGFIGCYFTRASGISWDMDVISAVRGETPSTTTYVSLASGDYLDVCINLSILDAVRATGVDVGESYLQCKFVGPITDSATESVRTCCIESGEVGFKIINSSR